MTKKRSRPGLNCKGRPLGNGTVSSKRKEEFKEKGRIREVTHMATEDELAKKVDREEDKKATNNERAKKLSEAEVKAFFPTEEERKKKKKEEEEKKKQAEKESTLDKKVDAASVLITEAASAVKTEAAGSVDKTLPSQEAAPAGSVDKTLPCKAPHPLDGVEKLTPALKAWGNTKKK